MAIELGEGLPDNFVEFIPPIFTSIDGTIVEGTGGSGGGWVELFMDETAEPIEARKFLSRVKADEDGSWSTTIPYELTGDQGIRTTLTTTKPDVIPGMRAGTTTGLSEELYPVTPADGLLNYVVSYPSGTWYIDSDGIWQHLTVSVAESLTFADMTTIK